MDVTLLFGIFVLLAIRKETTRILTDWWNK
jgi:hypothetical protein